MCGRFVIAGNKAAIRDAFSVDETFQDELQPSWNVAPMQGIPFVSEQLREGELVRRLEIARWGLVPVWSFYDTFDGGNFSISRRGRMTSTGANSDWDRNTPDIPANGYWQDPYDDFAWYMDNFQL